MHIRLMALGSRGDVQPYIALGLGLKQAGYDVSIAATADFQPFVEEYGLTMVASRMNLKTLIQKSEQSGKQRGKKAKWAFFDMLLEETQRLAQGADLLVYAPAAIFSVPHVVEKLGIPAIPTMLQPFMNPTRDFPAVGMPGLPLGGWYNHMSYGLLEKFLWLVLRPRINKWRREVLGLPPYAESGPFAALKRDQTPVLYGFSPTVLPKPAEWGDNVHITGYWFLPPTADWQPPADLVAFLEAGAPPVYIGFGSMASRDPEKMARLVLEAVQQAGVRAVLATGWGGLSALNVPESVYLLDSAPHEWLFPRMAAVVHHGGAGTTAAGLYAGKPSIIIPFKSDQPFWGKRVALLGAGPNPIPRKQLTADKLAAALRQAVNDPAMRERAAALGQTIRAEDGVGNAVRLIEATIRERYGYRQPEPIR